MLESLSSFLFKYPPEVFERGRFIMAWAPGVAVAVLVLLAIGLPLLAGYRKVGGRARRGDRIVLATIRAAVLLVLCFCLAGPALELSSAVPQRNVVGVLLDDSRSMTIADQDGQPRSAKLLELFGSDSAVARSLSERFQLRYFRFGSSSARINDPSELRFQDSWSRMAPALERTREDLAQVPLSGLVLVTDGADNSGLTTDSLLARLPSGVPLYVVGVGSERMQRDLELSAVESPTATLEGSTVAVDLVIRQAGYSGQTVQVQAEEAGRILATQAVTLGREGAAPPVRLFVPAPSAGLHTLQFRIPPAPGEALTENNVAEAAIRVRGGPERILYFEGEPRYELKFMRRAVADDRSLQLVTLLRTAERKYLRLGVRDSLELAAGFPDSREELFEYRGIILGSVEASAFSAEQLRMLEDFVRERGGGLIVLGGRRSLAEGGFTGTPLARVLPVALGPADTSFFAELTVTPTPPGLEEPALQLPGEGSVADRWSSLPPLSAVNRVGDPKPGATVLLNGRGEGAAQPVMAWQRFGRGRVMVLPVQDTWLWQMHADLAVEDQTHETLWRQLLRWVVSETPERLAVTASPERVPPGEPVTITADLRSEEYNAVNNARVVARVTAAGGQAREYIIPWSGRRDGEYRLTLVPDAPGALEVAVSAEVPGEGETVHASVDLQAGDSRQEMVGANLQTARLRQIAEASGGRFYPASEAGRLAQDIAIGGAGVTVREVRDLWDMPVIFLLLVGLLGTEWGYRRWRGLA